MYKNEKNTTDFILRVTPNQFFIGQRNGIEAGLSCEMKGFKIFNRILSQQEITDLYNA